MHPEHVEAMGEAEVERRARVEGQIDPGPVEAEAQNLRHAKAERMRLLLRAGFRIAMRHEPSFSGVSCAMMPR